MISITRTRFTSQLEKHLRPGLPDPNSYEGDEFIVSFQYTTRSKVKRAIHDTVLTARFIKQEYITHNASKKMWKWVYQGITE